MTRTAGATAGGRIGKLVDTLSHRRVGAYLQQLVKHAVQSIPHKGTSRSRQHRVALRLRHHERLQALHDAENNALLPVVNRQTTPIMLRPRHEIAATRTLSQQAPALGSSARAKERKLLWLVRPARKEEDDASVLVLQLARRQLSLRAAQPKISDLIF